MQKVEVYSDDRVDLHGIQRLGIVGRGLKGAKELDLTAMGCKTVDRNVRSNIKH